MTDRPSKPSAPELSSDILRHYETATEARRLLLHSGQLEFERTRAIVQRYLPTQPARVLDVGGASGIHSVWLAKLGYEVHLVDPVPRHVEQAAEALASFDHASVSEGNALRLQFPENSADVVLLLGPLYHLTERHERVQALREAGRVCRPGGFVVAAAISRFASLLDLYFHKQPDDTVLPAIVERDLRDGQHRNPTDEPQYFTTAYFHDPDELETEMLDAGLGIETLLPIEGPFWLLPDFAAHWDDPTRRGRLMHFLEQIEDQPSLLGASAHFLGIARVA